jgi:hypothetical protein
MWPLGPIVPDSKSGTWFVTHRLDRWILKTWYRIALVRTVYSELIELSSINKLSLDLGFLL